MNRQIALDNLNIVDPKIKSLKSLKAKNRSKIKNIDPSFKKRLSQERKKFKDLQK